MEGMATYRNGAPDYAGCLIEPLGIAHDFVATHTFDETAARDSRIILLGMNR